MVDHLDSIIDLYGIKYMFVESGIAIPIKCEEHGLLPDQIKSDWSYWIELSWGSDDEDEYDFAFNSFGTSFDDAFNSCIDAFHNVGIAGKDQQIHHAYKKYINRLSFI
jgi:hypothetical protein